jgi:parvulin-like peptidyl-prolyl isomerase
LRLAAAAAAATGLLLACGPRALPPSDAAAQVDGEGVPYQLFETYLENNVGSDAGSLSAVTQAKLFEQFLDEELLARYAVEEGMVDSELSHREAMEQILSRVSTVTLSDAEVQAYYQAHRDEFERPERVRVRQILVLEREQAEEALSALKQGEDFAEVARRLSVDPNARRGGEQGELSREDLPPRFAEPVFSLEEGEISPVVAAEYGYHIFQVVQRRGGALIGLEEAAAEIRDRLRQERADQALSDMLAAARGRYDVWVYGRNLPFEYRGAYRVVESSKD